MLHPLRLFLGLFLLALLPNLALAQETTQAEAPHPADNVKTWLKEVGIEPFDSVKIVAIKPKKEVKETFETKLDGFVGGINSAIGKYLFYDVGGASTAGDLEGGLIGSPTELREHIQAAADAARAKGINPGVSALTLSIDSVGGTAGSTWAVKRSGMPFAVLWLVMGAIFFTVRMGFVQLRALRHAVAVVRGKYDNPNDEGEVSHFQALTAALSATVGLGNIAGVAIAIAVGGPGATFWMILAGFLGMASKFTECTLGQMYRKQRPDGHVMGGAMYYLSDGLKDLGFAGIGRFLAVLFAILCIGGSLGGGNSFQVNQSMKALEAVIPTLSDYNWVYGAVMTAMVAAVILGGLKRIAQTAEMVVPTMCGIYVLAALFVILSNASHLPAAFSAIINGAFTPEAGFGGFLGVLVLGFKRAAFSNEAGVGSAAIAHSAAKTDYPVREGIVALLEPFIDTVVICTMTALVIVITGAYDPNAANGLFAANLENANGAALTSQAFGQVISWFPWVLGVAVVLFAFSTMISWSYYGERCWVWMFGESTSIFYKLLFLAACFAGSITSAGNVLDFGDLMILGMAVPNVLGVLLLSSKVRHAFNEYWAKYKAGEFDR
ncbi:MAG: alanine/glycine:cation symporter family protein [Planctomycetota bacterium]